MNLLYEKSRIQSLSMGIIRDGGVSLRRLLHNGSKTPNVNGYTTLIGAGTIFRGNITFLKSIRIEGQMYGSVKSTDGTVVIAGDGLVEGPVHAQHIFLKDNAVVKGEVIAGTGLNLESGARINGDVTCAAIQIDRGAQVNGKITMTDPTQVKWPRGPVGAEGAEAKSYTPL